MSSSDAEKAFMALTKATQFVQIFAEVKMRINILMFEARSESSAGQNYWLASRWLLSGAYTLD